MTRPSYKELYNKIKRAKEAVLGNRIAFVDPSVIAADVLEIGCLVEDILDVLTDILNEISPANYAGTSPPQRSYEADIEGCELFSFKWESTRLGCEIYLKFAFKDDLMWLVSFHQHRETKGGQNGKKGLKLPKWPWRNAD
ncbi:MAG: hypothetical protein JRJ77_08470 [Deltaproteobacteria bacterium]|nr:hypothetical protein [Deltaproteobacteria bacterium]MBW2339208.1 hypothetical protein [Deltaproteobacteria bacterium]